MDNKERNLTRGAPRSAQAVFCVACIRKSLQTCTGLQSRQALPVSKQPVVTVSLLRGHYP
jgi:hypothetical protein